MTARLPPLHLLLALAVVAVWGTNFAVIKHALDALPPLLLAALRFLFAALPAVLVLPRPKVSWRNLAAYGVAIGVGQFGLLYLALRSSISPGLASLVVQTQVFFTIGLATLMLGEKVRLHQWLALALAAAGIVVIGMRAGGDTTLGGVALVLAAAFCWASGNLIGKRAGADDMLGYVVWSSLFAVPPLFVLSLGFEGAGTIGAALRDADPSVWAAVLWQSVGNTMFCYAAWNWLLARHPAAAVAPLALLIPVFGMAASAWWLGEPMPAWKLGAAALVIGGLALNLWWPLAARGGLRPGARGRDCS